jgi:hypothetical protein
MQAWRGHRVRAQFTRKLAALATITLAVPRMRAFLVGQAERRKLSVLHRAAAVLQAVARGRSVRCRLVREHHAAVVLQAWAQGHAVRRRSSRKVRH